MPIKTTKGSAESWWAKIWKDPVWSAVISAGIVAGIVAVWVYLGNFGPRIAVWFIQVIDYLKGQSRAPVWLVLSTSLFSCYVVVTRVVSAIRHVLAEPTTNWVSQDYRKDSFFDIVWRWDYYGSSVNNVSSFCPFCDMQIEASSRSEYRIEYSCEDCQRSIRRFDHGTDTLRDKLVKRIDQKIRNGSWLEAVKVNEGNP